uniref:Uncharacterized protein n=1 Tax=Ditylenchus dipsaci TaxID=166011 RepID=A0A915ETC7_9BILA
MISLNSGLKHQKLNFCHLITVSYIWVVVLSSRVESLIRTSASGTVASKLMKPTPDLANKNPAENAFFRPKSYTVNDFHLLVEGMQVERQRLDQKAAENVSDMLQRILKLEENQKVSSLSSTSSDFASWMDRMMQPWMCHYASLIGLFVVVMGVLILLVSSMFYCCRKGPP